jgi:hypothetical protein
VNAERRFFLALELAARGLSLGGDFRDARYGASGQNGPLKYQSGPLNRRVSELIRGRRASRRPEELQ